MTQYGAIAIVDQSDGDSGWDQSQMEAVRHALWHQLRYHVQKSYRYVAPALLVCDADSIPDNAWPIYILRDPDVAGALGLHDLDPHGRPYGRVFTSVCRQAGVSLSSVLSHEVVEAFVDPYANDWSDAGRQSVAHEACDPVQNSTYEIHGVEVSNFVTREWFDAAAVRDPAREHQFDWLDHLDGPFELEAGGYLIVMEDGQVGNVYGSSGATGAHSDYRDAAAAGAQPSRSTWREVRALLTEQAA